ncbi:thioredoxin family protein [Rhodoferax saidenbachensis]|uniref:Thiol-disulfide isomerase/thioredoxin n=1 Tax=Rhodoferax saidenbachensis TaxID=1484693 RepID=A0ABU1ZHK4_9BURK|nr:thioredoxin family protein [Rhodoferax saidenbachensis]MDR7304878.1 thiol-disulfide isomerase/thioredoxin [Rhodoferax saidenbachensis]
MPNTATPPQTAPATLLVACLCAQWCGTCNDYQPLFAQLQTDFPGAKFVWVDIEDEADLVDPIEVENFPTLLIATGETPRFFGTVMPHGETLRRLLQSTTEAGATTVVDPEVVALAQRLRAR